MARLVKMVKMVFLDLRYDLSYIFNYGFQHVFRGVVAFVFSCCFLLSCEFVVVHKYIYNSLIIKAIAFQFTTKRKKNCCLKVSDRPVKNVADRKDFVDIYD